MKRSLTYKKFNTTTENHKIRFEVYYSKGGMNFFSGTKEERGYYLSVQPYEDRGNGIITMLAFSGVKRLFVAAHRFSEKQLNNIFALLKDDDFKSLLDNVLAKNALVIAQS